MPPPRDPTPPSEGLDARVRELFERHAAEVFRFFVRKRFPYEESRELTQETFLRVYQGLREFRGESRERTWIFSIARNLMLNARRHGTASKRQGTEIPLEELGAGERGSSPAPALADRTAPDPLAETLDRERRELLRQAMAALPPRMRQCVLLRVAQDRKYREIADLLGISIDTVKSQLHQAKGRLRQLLGERYDGLDRLDDGGSP
jgi:RNA polymerase sigma-70 factor (ECF subfamily)